MEKIDPKQFAMAVTALAEDKNLPNDVVQEAIEHALASAYRKDYEGRETEVRVNLNVAKGDVHFYVKRDVVEKIDDEETQITLEDAKKHNKEAVVGEPVEYEVHPDGFGRVAAQTAKQVILQMLREAEREIIFDEYQDKVGTLLNGVIQRADRRMVTVDIGRASGIIPMSERIPNENFSPGQRVKVYLKEVEASTRGPQVILSRACPEFIHELFLREVPEMENGAVEIKVIAREPGTRTKIAVASNTPGVDPVGTFVGGHGTRVQAVMGEVGDQEKIDIIMWNADLATFITNALSPTEVDKVELDEENQKATVKVKQDQLSIAIGRQGQNVRLASKLTGIQLDIEANGEIVEHADADALAPEQPKTTAKRQKRHVNPEDALLSALEQHGAEDSTDKQEEEKE